MIRRNFYSLAAVLGSTCALATLSNAVTARADGPVKYPAGRVVVYDGSAEVRQIQGSDSDVAKFVAGEIVAVGEKGQRISLLRSIRDTGSDDDVSASHNVFKIRGNGLEAVEPPMELDDAQHVVNIYLPVRLRIPATKSGTSEQTLNVVNSIPLTTKVKTDIDTSGDGTSYKLSLADGVRPKFDFRGNPATLTQWNESYIVDAAGTVKSRGFDYALDVSIEGNSITLAVKSELTATSVITNPREGDGKAAKALDALAEIEAGLAKHNGSAASTAKVDALAKLVAGSPLTAIGQAARSHLGGYVQLFESDDSGRVLAKIIGKKAPNFTLEDLEGKKVDFNKAISGNVAYLVFWGVG